MLLTIIRLIVALGALALSTSAGINWKTVWLEPNPVILQPGSSVSYVVKGIAGRDYLADLTDSLYLKITSSDESIVAVDRDGGRLIGKAVGRVERSECRSVSVRA